MLKFRKKAFLATRVRKALAIRGPETHSFMRLTFIFESIKYSPCLFKGFITFVLPITLAKFGSISLCQIFLLNSLFDDAFCSFDLIGFNW